MFGFGKNKDHANTREDGFKKGMAIFADFAALAAAFFGTGPAYSATVDFVRDFSARHYGADITGLVEIGWFVIVAGGIFGLSRATVYTSIIALAFTVAARIA